MLASRKRFGTTATISTIALVLLMAGAAVAAKKYLITSTSQIKPSVLKKLQGADGAAGQAGSQGPQGPAGANGQDGAKGATGEKGAAGGQGAQGNPGIGVTVTTESPGSNCANGGYKLASSKLTPDFVCNGLNGTPGAPGAPGSAGDPWTPESELPEGATLTGAWSYPGGLFSLQGTISFPVQLAESIPGASTHFIRDNVIESEAIVPAPVPPECDDGEGAAPSASNPEADPGHLCVFVSLDVMPPFEDEENEEGLQVDPGLTIFNLGGTFTAGASKTGALLSKLSGTPPTEQFGSYAVTAKVTP